MSPVPESGARLGQGAAIPRRHDLPSTDRSGRLVATLPHLVLAPTVSIEPFTTPLGALEGGRAETTETVGLCSPAWPATLGALHLGAQATHHLPPQSPTPLRSPRAAWPNPLKAV